MVWYMDVFANTLQIPGIFLSIYMKIPEALGFIALHNAHFWDYPLWNRKRGERHFKISSFKEAIFYAAALRRVEPLNTE